MAEQLHEFRSGDIARRIWLFLALVLLFEVILIAIAPRWHSGSVLKIAKDAACFRLGNDSWYYMAQGDLAWRQHPDTIYETAFFQRGIRFIYPPTSLLALRGWRSSRLVHAQPFFIFKITLLLAFLGTWLVSCRFLFAQFSSAAFKASTGGERWKVRIAVALLACVFLPLVNALALGQVQTLMNFLLIASALLWLRGRRIVPGIFIGLCCWLKPQLALFLIWGLLRRKWSFSASLLSMLIVGLIVSLAVFGLHNTAEYLTVLQYLSRHGDALATNQSLNGLLHRLMHIGSPVTWIYGYPPYNRTIYLATLSSSALLLGVALVIPVLRRWSGTILDFLLFAMATTMASPIAWEHHYGIFFLVFLLWMPIAFESWRVFAIVLAMYLLMTDTWGPLASQMYTPWTFAISHVYFGGILLFIWTLFRGDRLTAVFRTSEVR